MIQSSSSGRLNIIIIMTKLFITLAVVCLAGLAYSKDTLENCQCWDHYEAKQDSDGKVSCHGKLLFAIKPCNLPLPPKCVCTEDTVTGILTDKEGTWCSQSKTGVLQKKWPCENKDAWAAYQIKYEEFEKNYKA